ncbi:MAG TPA: CPBP family intramembrane glutamic endopeptidase [Vicinamibacterales bacterium]|nr:CPBP family intramembrane glutamic endopeptidase [Vicinamibacterales bacterium]
MSRRGRAIALYIGVAYGLTWLIWWPYLRAARSGSAPPGPFIYYLAALGPFVGALLAERYERGWTGVSDLCRRLVDWHRPGWWLVVGVGSPLLLIPFAVGPGYALTGAWPAWDLVGVSGRAPGLGPVWTWLLMTASYGIGEEVGWRGFLLPRLQSNHSALRSTLLLTVIWGAWHLPAFGFREGYVGLGVVGVVGFLIGLAAGAVVLTSLYNAARGSILAVALWHGTWNWVATSDAFGGTWVAIMTGIIMAAAPLVVLAWGAQDLAPSRRSMVPSADPSPTGGR